MTTQYTLPFEAPKRRPTWTGLARSPLMALEERKEFLTALKSKQKMIENDIPVINKRKTKLIEAEQARYEALVWAAVASNQTPPEKPDLTAYVAEHLHVTGSERAHLTSFLLAAYLNSYSERWERIRDAELFNTARRVYRKLDGTHGFDNDETQCMKLNTLIARATKDREHYTNLTHVLPLITGIGFGYHVETDEATGRGVRIPTPMFMVGYSTTEKFWTAYKRMHSWRINEIGEVHGAAQVKVAKRHLKEFSTVLVEHYQSRVNGLEILVEPMDPKKRFEI